MGSLRPGSPVGRYVVEGVLGSGGMGVVYSARDTVLERTVALKVMAEHLADDPAFRERFGREAAVLGRLDSPHIVSVLDQGEEDGLLWIATTRIDGGDLDQQISARGPLPPMLAADVVAQVAEGLEDAHRAGILHRDVKAGNVLLAVGTGSDAGSGTDVFHAVLTDFGVAQDTAGQTALTTGAAGTWAYLAPERGRGEPATVASDVYSVGCLLFACLSGHPPFVGTDPEVALAHARIDPPRLPGRDPVSRQLDAVAQRALAKDPAQRHRSAGELAADLAGIAAGNSPVHTKLPRRRTGTVTAAVAACALILAAGGVVAWQVGDGDEPDERSAVKRTGNSGATDEPAPDPIDRPITADFDDDGFGDVALTTLVEGYPTQLARSDGQRFSEPAQFATGAADMSWGDFDGDDVADLVTIAQVGEDYKIQVISDDVDRQRVPAPRGSTVYNPTIGDYDGDGHDDIALISDTEGSGLRVWVSRSDGKNFTDFEQWYDDDRTAKGPVAGDFDGDGDSDLAIIDTSGIELLESDGTATFTTHGRQSLTNSPGSWSRAAGGDLDGDGIDELVSISAPTVSAWRYVEGEWEDEVLVTAEQDDGLGTTPVIGDFNGDRRDDVAVVRGGVGVTDLELLVMLSDGTQLAAPESWLVRKCGCRDTTSPVRRLTTL
ncbi:MAG: serine/threonine protein kinase [Nocardioidaceae bacterium]|nr:serine/threonine protein kinase [Nocardioidaceae bacterium]